MNKQDSGERRTSRQHQWLQSSDDSPVVSRSLNKSNQTQPLEMLNRSFEASSLPSAPDSTHNFVSLVEDDCNTHDDTQNHISQSLFENIQDDAQTTREQEEAVEVENCSITKLRQQNSTQSGDLFVEQKTAEFFTSRDSEEESQEPDSCQIPFYYQQQQHQHCSYADNSEDEVEEERCKSIEDWSLKSLRKKFALKNTEIHFERYQRRLAKRLFSVLLILNILTTTIDTVTFLYVKSVPALSPFVCVRVIALLINTLCLVGCIRAERRTGSHQHRHHRHQHHRETQWNTGVADPTAQKQQQKYRTTPRRRDSLSFNFFSRTFRLSISHIASLVFLCMLLIDFGAPLLSYSLKNFYSEESLAPLLRLRPAFYLIICAQLLLPYTRRRSALVCFGTIALLELLCTYILKQESCWLLESGFDCVGDRRAQFVRSTLLDADRDGRTNGSLRVDLNSSQLFLHTAAIGRDLNSSAQSLTPLSNAPLFLPVAINVRSFIAEMLFYLVALVVAFYIAYLLEIVNRRAFLDHRKCVESKFRLTFEKDEQERLLASCLPKHLMKKVRDDIRSRLTLKLLQATQAAAAALGASSNNCHVVHSCPDESLTTLTSSLTTASITVDVNNNSKLQSQETVRQKHGSQGSISRPFKELYIDKHENVTILYADIVNSMLLTQALRSPKALVETLNGLFGRFDQAADRRNCLRIKILGDCYYCISGIPDYDPKHAVNCIEMALDMIDIIRTFRIETGINLDMRIGVHSGTVLSGLIGLKKWQFDIWSLDAMKAARMESTGVPGQVHCSAMTLSLIPDDVQQRLTIVENNFSYSESSENETTFLIERRTSRRTVVSEPNGKSTTFNVSHELLLSIDELGLSKNIPDTDDESKLAVAQPRTRRRSSCRIDIDDSIDVDNEQILHSKLPSPAVISSRSSAAHVQDLTRRRTIMEVISSLTAYSNMVRYSNDSIAATIDSMPLPLGKQYQPTTETEIHPVFLYFLRRSSTNCERRCSEELAEIPSPKPNTLQGIRRKLYDSFRVDWTQEKLFLSQPDFLYPYYLGASLAISFSILVIRYLTLFDSSTFEPEGNNFWLEPSNLAIYMSILVTSFGLVCCYVSTATVKRFAIRMLFWIFICGSLIVSTVLDMQRCWIAMDIEAAEISPDNPNPKICLIKWSRYYTYCCVLALCSVSLFIRINLWVKFAMSTTGLLALALTNRYSHCSVFDQLNSGDEVTHSKHSLAFSHFQYLFLVYLMFHVLDRQIEYLSRLDFLWATKLKIERARAKLMREVNQLLLKNILPIHVANRFLANPEQTRELYYETYTSCAVMFAAIPNFFKFYTETPETDDGLMYISLLNDIICEFDKLLLSSHFKQRIEKIKTIGSTYMAAAGLHPGRASIDNATTMTVQKETQNLLYLIRFAMSMMKVLGKLNTQSSVREVMEHKKKSAAFKLRIGIASGPVIAGVVGALKPQYDIWGDTVNVASRMDTSGVANKIHFPENVAKMLQENTDFIPESRGILDIKGKGSIETFLIDYDPEECPD